MSKYQITEENSLNELDGLLKSNFYIGGNFPNAEDAAVFEQFTNGKTEPNQDKHLNLWSWYSLITLYQPHIRESWKAAAPKQQGKTESKENKDNKECKDKEQGKKPHKKSEDKKDTTKEVAKPANDEMDDLFAEETPEEKQKLAELQKQKEKEKGEKKKPAVIAKSLVILDVKIWEPEQDLDELASRIIKIEKDGLLWKTEYKLQDVAFGIKKITIGCVVEDEKVSVDDIIDELQEWENDVQSVDIVAFNKI